MQIRKRKLGVETTKNWSVNVQSRDCSDGLRAKSS